MGANSTARLVARVEGRVQGVGFRYFVRNEASRLDVSGWVRNERDGTVAVVAEGSRTDLERLASRLRIGPPMAVVRHVALTWSEAKGEAPGFQIR